MMDSQHADVDAAAPQRLWPAGGSQAHDAAFNAAAPPDFEGQLTHDHVAETPKDDRLSSWVAVFDFFMQS
jgi:hypothetical protein